MLHTVDGGSRRYCFSSRRFVVWGCDGIAGKKRVSTDGVGRRDLVYLRERHLDRVADADNFKMPATTLTFVPKLRQFVALSV